MMAAQKHLHELLREDQEPFQLNNYIADRRCQLKRAATHKITTSALQPKKLRKPMIESSSSKRSLCKQACFFSLHDSPDVRKSPFPSPANKSPCKSPSGAVFLHIPAKTAAMLLEAAMKIQKQSSKPKKAHVKNIGFGLFGSILKRLKDKSKTKKPEIGVDAARFSVQDDSFMANRKSTRKSQKLEGIIEGMSVDENVSGNYEMGFSFSCNNSRLSSAGWSESNEDKSLDMETSCSTSRSDYTEEIIDFASCEKHFCLSPLSPFRFALQRSPSAGRRTPDLSSPAASPSRHIAEERENHVGDNLQKIQLEDEEEKDQCSPVSVLDPPFEDDDDEQDAREEEEEEEEEEKEEEEDDDYDLECSYAIVQRAKLQLLHKLRRFERLAELDPIELEKRMSEDQEDEDDNEDLIEEEEWVNIDESRSFCIEENDDEFIREVFSKSKLCRLNKIPSDFKRLVLDLIAEEKKNGFDYSNEVIMSKVCKRLDSWKEVESNTIDMMVELDLRRELDGWKRYQEEMGEKAMEIEIAIFGLLVEELVS